VGGAKRAHGGSEEDCTGNRKNIECTKRAHGSSKKNRRGSKENRGRTRIIQKGHRRKLQ